MEEESKKWFEELEEMTLEDLKKAWCCRWNMEVGITNMEESLRLQFPNLPQWFGVNYCMKCGSPLKPSGEIPPVSNNSCCILVKDQLCLTSITAMACDEEGKPIAMDDIKVEYCPHCGGKLEGLQKYTEYWRDNHEIPNTYSGEGEYKIQKINSCFNCFKATWKEGEGKCHKFLKLSVFGICNEHQNYEIEGGCNGGCC